MELKDALKNRGIRLLQYGDSGVGKSIRASEAARWGKVQYHDFDEQTQNLASYLTEVYPERVDKIEVITYAGLPDAKKWERFDKTLTVLEAGTHDIKTLVIDSYTRFENVYFNFLASVYNPATGSFGTPRKTVKIGQGDELILPGTNDYFILAAAVKKITGRLKDLQVNVIVNAHVRDYIENRQQIVSQGTIQAAGQIRAFLPTEFTEFHRLFVDDYGKHRVQAKPSRYWLAKTSLTNIPQNGILKDGSLEVFDERAIKCSK
jgi:hypothetical protein